MKKVTKEQRVKMDILEPKEKKVTKVIRERMATLE